MINISLRAICLFTSTLICFGASAQTRINLHIPVDSIKTELATQASKNYYLIDISATYQDGKEQLVALWKKGVKRDVIVKAGMSNQDFLQEIKEMKKLGYRPDDIEVYTVADEEPDKIAAIFLKAEKEWEVFSGSLKDSYDAKEKEKKMAENGYNIVVVNQYRDHKRDKKYYYIVGEKNNVPAEYDPTTYFDSHHKYDKLPYKLNNEKVIWQNGNGGYYSVKKLKESKMIAENLHAEANGYECMGIMADSYGGTYSAFYKANGDKSLFTHIRDLADGSWAPYFSKRLDEMEQLRKQVEKLSKADYATSLPEFHRMQWLFYSRLIDIDDIGSLFPEYSLVAWAARNKYIDMGAEPKLEKNDYSLYAVFKQLPTLSNSYWGKDWNKTFDIWSASADISELLFKEGTYIKFKAIDTSSYRNAAIAASMSGHSNMKYNLKLMEMKVKGKPSDWLIYYSGLLHYGDDENKIMYKKYMAFVKQNFPEKAENWAKIEKEFPGL